MSGDTQPSEVEVMQVGLGDPRARTLEAAHIAEMNLRYGTGGPGHVAEEGFDPPLGCFLLALIDGTPVGCGGFRRLDRRRAEIKRMYVDPAVRGHGVGRALLAAIEVRAGLAGYGEVWLETGSEQPEAIALYVSSGYVPVAPYGEFKDDSRSRCFTRPLTT
jgi:GNAT superfamily N-acetyltransferase